MASGGGGSKSHNGTLEQKAGKAGIHPRPAKKTIFFVFIFFQRDKLANMSKWLHLDCILSHERKNLQQALFCSVLFIKNLLAFVSSLFFSFFFSSRGVLGF
jgi:hypothetical protein